MKYIRTEKHIQTKPSFLVQRFSISIGLCLVVLGIIGQSKGIPSWVYSLDYLAAVLAVFIAAVATARSSIVFRVAAPMTLSAGLFSVAVATYSQNLSTWVTGWTFVFAVAFLLVGLGASSGGIFERIASKRKGTYGQGGDLIYLNPHAQGYRFGWGHGWDTPLEAPMINHSGRGPRNFQRSDDRITEEIHERLTISPLIDATEVSIQVKNGEVILTGIVENRRARRIAEEIVDSVFGVTEIENRITTKKTKIVSSKAA